ncbi:MAG: manganese efflux pump MntP family protein [Bacteroidales bacterium]
MNLFEIALISLALAFNTSGICLAAGYLLRKSETGFMLRFLFILVTTQLIFSFTGLLLGKVISGIFPSAIQWIALSLLVMMGLKILYQSLQAKPEDWSFITNELRVVIRLSLATSIDPFIVSAAIGFLAPTLPNTILVIGATFLLFCSAWLIIGRIRGTASFKLRLGTTGGLILLAAGLHLFLKLIR